MAPLPADKLTDDPLRAFAATGDAEEVRSVIVELGTPPPRMRPRSVRPSPRVAVARKDLADVEGAGESMDELEGLLRGLDLPASPVRLNAAQAFVVSVTPEQLRTLAAWPLTGLVRSNRTHHVPRAMSR